MLTYENIKNIRELVHEVGKDYPDMDYIRYYRDEKIQGITFKEFSKQMDSIGAWIGEQSTKLGHSVRVAMLSVNSVLYAKMIIGVMCGGGVAIPMDVQMDEDTLCRCINKAETDILIYESSLNFDEKKLFKECPRLTSIYHMDEDNNSEKSCERIINDYMDKANDYPISENECATILFTSGTTGEEKGVMLSHGNLIDNVFSKETLMHEIKVNVLPFHHAYCLNADLIICLTSASTICINGGIANLGENLRIFEPTHVNMVPMIAQGLYTKLLTLSESTGKTLKECKSKVFGKRIDKVIAGGAHLPAELVDKYQAIGISLAQGYGMTESAPLISSPVSNRPDKAKSAGKIGYRCQTRIVDGELQVKSPSVMMGYVNAPELTAEVITEDGWLRTGDIGEVDDEGFLYIKGRIKNLIILSNGENVSPEQLENLLLDNQIIDECLVYGEGNIIIAEIYPNSKYALMNNIEDVPTYIDEIIHKVNEQLPSYKRIMKHVIRTCPFKRTSTKKIIRNQRASKDEILNLNSDDRHMPTTEVQQVLYKIIKGILGHDNFGTNTDIFRAGLDSLGCIMLLSTFEEELDFNITLDELMQNTSIEDMEQLYTKQQNSEKMDYSPRPIYPLTKLQMYFAYIMRGHTTANIPFLFELNSSVDINKLHEALNKLFVVHPILNNVIQMYEDKGFANFRKDDREINIPIHTISQKEWEECKKTLVRPYNYGPGEALYHIELYVVEDKQYLFFDVAHIISDGASLGIMLENLNALYCGKDVQTEEYTFFDYILDEKRFSEDGVRERNVNYFTSLMNGMEIKRSILNRKGHQKLASGKNAALRKRFESINLDEVQKFCRDNNISENILFVTAFNQCISMFSDLDDTISTSIHNGRTDSRWARMAGCIFTTYNFRCKINKDTKVKNILKESAKQVMDTMCCRINNLHADEMFIQYQGSMFSDPTIGGAKAKNLPLQLDSLPFHLMIHQSERGYHYELRYWANRYERKQLSIFMEIYESVINAMLTEEKVVDLYNHIPAHLLAMPHTTTSAQINNDVNGKLVKVDTVKVAVYDRYGHIQPYGAWGTLYLDGKATKHTVRILPDNTIDFIENSGRVVMHETLAGRNFLDLHKLEQVLLDFDGIVKANGYICYGADNNLILTADIVIDSNISKNTLIEHLVSKLDKPLLPHRLIVNGKEREINYDTVDSRQVLEV